MLLLMKCIRMNPSNIIFVKVGTKYSYKHVNALYDQLSVLYPLAKFWCYTDDAVGIDQSVNIIDPLITLKKWWAKLALFSDKMPFEGSCLFFDLDAKVNDSIDGYLDTYDGLTIINAYWKSHLTFQPHDYDVKINSSIIKWTAGTQQHIWKHFLSNKDYFMRKYKGIDRFIHYEGIEYNTFEDGIANSVQLNKYKAPVELYNGMEYEVT